MQNKIKRQFLFPKKRQPSLQHLTCLKISTYTLKSESQFLSVSRNSKPGLSTIPEVSTQRELNNNQNQNIQNTANQLKPATQYQPVSQPPDLLVHSGNWQEHSFDSSVVTEGKTYLPKAQ